MSISDKIELLLAYVTDSERNLFDRMYPDGVKLIKNKKTALQQVEQTLLNRAKKIEELRNKNTKLELELDELRISHKKEIRDLGVKFEEKLNLKDEKVNTGEKCRDCALLNALEAAGVDNWEGYEYAIDLLKEWDN